jgi:hypothetical protein
MHIRIQFDGRIRFDGVINLTRQMIDVFKWFGIIGQTNSPFKYHRQ